MKERAVKQLIERETGEIPLMGQNVNAEREGEQETQGPWGHSLAPLVL